MFVLTDTIETSHILICTSEIVDRYYLLKIINQESDVYTCHLTHWLITNDNIEFSEHINNTEDDVVIIYDGNNAISWNEKYLSYKPATELVCHLNVPENEKNVFKIMIANIKVK